MHIKLSTFKHCYIFRHFKQLLSSLTIDLTAILEDQKSPSKFCKDKFNPDPDYIEEHEELFELNNLHF